MLALRAQLEAMRVEAAESERRDGRHAHIEQRPRRVGDTLASHLTESPPSCDERVNPLCITLHPCLACSPHSHPST